MVKIAIIIEHVRGQSNLIVIHVTATSSKEQDLSRKQKAVRRLTHTDAHAKQLSHQLVFVAVVLGCSVVPKLGSQANTVVQSRI